MSKKIKVVLHSMSGSVEDPTYGNHGVMRYKYEEAAGGEIEFVSFAGQYLQAFKENGDNFLKECANADVVILDAWNHGDAFNIAEDPEESEAYFARQVREQNPLAKVFAQLMEGVRKVAVHEFAEPHISWSDESIMTAIKQLASIEESLPWVLVADDSEVHAEAAEAQLTQCRLVIARSYIEAENLIQKYDFDVVLVDLMLPAPGRTMGEKGKVFVGQEMPLGNFLVLLALSRGVKKIGLLTDSGHHDHPASACVDAFNRGFRVGDSKVLLSNKHLEYQEEQKRVIKNWKSLLDDLSPVPVRRPAEEKMPLPMGRLLSER